MAAAFLFMMTLLQFVGTLTGGVLGDRFSKRWLVVACMAMHSVGLLMLSHATGPAMVVAFCIFHGLAWGWRGPQMMAIRADYYGRSSFGKIMGISSLVIIVGTISGPIIAGLITGSFIVEQLFSLPGTGRLFVQSVNNRDYGLIMGATLFYAAVIMAVNLAIDLAYAVVDPRIRYR